MNARWSSTAVLAVFALLPLGVGCGGGGGGSGTDCAPPVYTTLSGTWSVTEVESVTSNPALCQDDVDTYEAIVTQDGNRLTVQMPSDTYGGTLCGDVFTPDEPIDSFPEDGGTTTVTNRQIVFHDDSNITVTNDWTWTGPGGTCGGTTTSTATKQ